MFLSSGTNQISAFVFPDKIRNGSVHSYCQEHGPRHGGHSADYITEHLEASSPLKSSIHFPLMNFIIPVWVTTNMANNKLVPTADCQMYSNVSPPIWLHIYTHLGLFLFRGSCRKSVLIKEVWFGVCLYLGGLVWGLYLFRRSGVYLYLGGLVWGLYLGGLVWHLY